MFCDKCGTQLPDGSNFCTNCGNKIGYPTGTPQQQIPTQASYQRASPDYGYHNQTQINYGNQQVQPNYNQADMYANTQNNYATGQAERIAQSIRTGELITSILWICIGLYQFYIAFSFVTDDFYFMIPIWNIANAIIGITNISKITAGNSSVIKNFTNRIVHTIIAFCVNAYIGAWLGCLLAISELGLSIYVLNHKSIFTNNITKSIT